MSRHFLRVLMDLLASHGKSVPSELADIDLLTPYGTLFRYDIVDDSSDPFDRKAARDMIRQLRAWVESLVTVKPTDDTVA